MSCTKSDDPKVLFDKGDYQSAYRLWLPMAEQGDSQAQNYIGIQNYLGLGIRRNHKQAKEWFEKAAIKGLADAQHNLAVMYENGESVTKDFTKAYMWFYLARENGNTHSENRMQAMAEEHKLFPNQMKQAIELAKEYRKYD